MNTENQTATLPAPNSVSNASRTYDDKETVAAWSVVATDKQNAIKEIIIVRWYAGRSAKATVLYCNVWIRGGLWCSGHGSANGGGYDKKSAALAYALESAGVKLSQPIDGRGDGTSRTALETIAKAMGFENFLIIEH